jgi:hypothetical protein
MTIIRKPARAGNGLKRIRPIDKLSRKHRSQVVQAQPTTRLDIRKSPNTRIRGNRTEIKNSRRRYHSNVREPKETFSDMCPKCDVRMTYLGTEVESDEAPYGGEFDGDFEMGTSAREEYRCPECNREYYINLGFRGSGLLR